MLLQLLELAEYALSGVAVARRLIAVWSPVIGAPTLLNPLVAVGSVLALALLTGVAVASLSTLIVAALILYTLLTEVFGISFEIDLP